MSLVKPLAGSENLSCALAVLASVFALFHTSAVAIEEEAGPKIGDIPPPLAVGASLQGLPSPDISWARLQSNVVVLEFWATWCGPCVKAIPHWNTLAEQFQSRPVTFLSVTSENPQVVRKFLQQHAIKGSIAIDDYQALSKAFHVRGIPHTVIVGLDGRIAAITHPSQLEARHLEEVLSGTKSSLPAPEIYTQSDAPRSEVVSSDRPPLFEISVRERNFSGNMRGPACTWTRDPDGCGLSGKLATVESGLWFVFDRTPSRMKIEGKLPEGFYDFRIRVPADEGTKPDEQFIAALRATFGLEVKRTMRDMDAYELTQIHKDRPGLHPTDKRGGGGQMRGGFRLSGSEMKTIVYYLELALEKPVFDETNLEGLFDADMQWEVSDRESEFHPTAAAVIEAAKSRLGLQLMPVRRQVEILEIRTVSAGKP
jgi:thiol-disulfide isomerase/thioredoxin